ncbi:hypothetical protein JZU61_04240 [bacterium]|nr:hypothetical protein [bacterium]MBV5348850.1 hypothetical protein [bacterium]
MKMPEFEVLKNRLEQAAKVLSDKYELSLRMEQLQRIIRGEKCVYEGRKDSRRYPTVEEVEKAKLDLLTFTEKVEALEAEFASM